MYHYSMSINWSDEDDAFIVEFPDFPDCKTHGDNYQEAAKNGEEVLELLIETYKAKGKKLPKPKVVYAEI